MRKARAIQLNVPVYKKVLLTVEEASDYSGFGVNKVRNLIKEKNANFVVNNGNKHLIMREKFEQYILNMETYA
ncbi:MAG: excisionase [Solobacterium sp.]|nr:DUF6462 family protein [Solobacterium sp.]MDD7776657.1 excisionase [Solobacterium sp.]MDY2952236.1 excisionase [Erysipelotrichaceae bacterium]